MAGYFKYAMQIISHSSVQTRARLRSSPFQLLYIVWFILLFRTKVKYCIRVEKLKSPIQTRDSITLKFIHLYIQGIHTHAQNFQGRYFSESLEGGGADAQKQKWGAGKKFISTKKIERGSYIYKSQSSICSMIYSFFFA